MRLYEEVDEAPESLDVQELQQEVITFNFEHKGGNLAIPCAISWTSERTIETCLRTNPHLAPTPELIDVIQQLHQTRVRPQLFVALNSLVSQLEERIENDRPCKSFRAHFQYTATASSARLIPSPPLADTQPLVPTELAHPTQDSTFPASDQDVIMSEVQTEGTEIVAERWSFEDEG